MYMWEKSFYREGINAAGLQCWIEGNFSVLRCRVLVVVVVVVVWAQFFTNLWARFCDLQSFSSCWYFFHSHLICVLLWWWWWWRWWWLPSVLLKILWILFAFPQHFILVLEDLFAWVCWQSKVGSVSTISIPNRANTLTENTEMFLIGWSSMVMSTLFIYS